MQPVTYGAYAVRLGTLPQFRVAGLVAGADPSRRADIPVMVWLLKGSNGRRVLVDSGFYRQKLVDQWKVQSFRTPPDAVTAAGVRPDEITDIIVSHAHWDHVGGARSTRTSRATPRTRPTPTVGLTVTTCRRCFESTWRGACGS